MLAWKTPMHCRQESPSAERGQYAGHLPPPRSGLACAVLSIARVPGSGPASALVHSHQTDWRQLVHSRTFPTSETDTVASHTVQVARAKAVRTGRSDTG